MSRLANRGQELDQIGAVIRVDLVLRLWSFFTTGCVRRVFWIVGNGRAQPFGSYLLTSCLDSLDGLYRVVT